MNIREIKRLRIVTNLDETEDDIRYELESKGYGILCLAFERDLIGGKIYIADVVLRTNANEVFNE